MINTLIEVSNSFLWRFSKKGVLKEEVNMENETRLMGRKKKIALVAHDNKKKDLLEWVKFNRYLLSLH